jgi:hypothetical protein
MTRYVWSQNGWRTREKKGTVTPPPPPVDRDALGAYGTYKPSLETTGVLPGVTRTTLTGNTTFTASTTIENRDIYGKMSFSGAGPFVFRNCYLHDILNLTTVSEDSMIRATNAAAANITFIDCTIIPDTPSVRINGILGHNYKLFRCQFRNCSDAIGMYNTAATSASLQIEVQGCYADNLAFFRPSEAKDPPLPEGTHNDCIQIQSGGGILIRGNTLIAMKNPAIGDAGFPDPGDGSGNQYYPSMTANAAVQILADVGPIQNGVEIDKNWLFGGGATINCADQGTALANFRLTDNVFSNAGQPYSPRVGWDAIITRATYDSGVISGNTREDGSAPAILRG